MWPARVVKGDTRTGVTLLHGAVWLIALLLVGRSRRGFQLKVTEAFEGTAIKIAARSL